MFRSTVSRRFGQLAAFRRVAPATMLSSSSLGVATSSSSASIQSFVSGSLIVSPHEALSSQVRFAATKKKKAAKKKASGKKKAPAKKKASGKKKSAKKKSAKKKATKKKASSKKKSAKASGKRKAAGKKKAASKKKASSKKKAASKKTASGVSTGGFNKSAAHYVVFVGPDRAPEANVFLRNKELDADALKYLKGSIIPKMKRLPLVDYQREYHWTLSAAAGAIKSSYILFKTSVFWCLDLPHGYCYIEMASDGNLRHTVVPKSNIETDPDESIRRSIVSLPYNANQSEEVLGWSFYEGKDYDKAVVALNNKIIN